MKQKKLILDNLGKSLLLCIIFPCLIPCTLTVSGASPSVSRPNILWLVAEDINAHLGCYGDGFADTPNINKLAQKGMRYQNVWSSAPVCAPARTALISGMYPPAVGGEHMRSGVSLPNTVKLYPQYLRDAGYYCVNNAKTDYNIRENGKVWHESSRKAHYQNRPQGRPFFAAFNHEITHESQIRKRPHTLIHSPDKARIPAYHPDTPEVRQDWAQYYDNITTMDAQVGQKLNQLKAEGLEEDTIVFFYGDNGSGMPRSKRWPYNSGLQVPLVIFVPEKFKKLAPKEYQPGGSSDRLISFVDFAPTLLSLAGIKPPAHFQGKPFMGQFEASPADYLYGFRGRMDERYDLVRSVRDKRYVYIRNFMPHKIYGQHISYMFETPTTRIWKQLFDSGKLNQAQSRFWQAKAPEELYDLEKDPDEINNLVESPAHAAVLERMRRAQSNYAIKIRDVGFLPEDEIHSRAANRTPYEMGSDDTLYPIKEVVAMADLASRLEMDVLPELKVAFNHKDSAVRYWAAQGIVMRGRQGYETAKTELNAALNDRAPSVRIAAAESLVRWGTENEIQAAISVLVALAPQGKNAPYVSMQALNVLELLGKKLDSHLDVIKESGKPDPKAEPRASSYAARLVEKIMSDNGK